MTDEEKAEKIIKEKYCNNCEERETFPNIYNCSNKEHCDDFYLWKEGILLGLAEGRKEKQTIIDTQTVQIESRDVYLIEKENAELKAMEKVWVDFSKFDFCEDTYKHFLFKLENGKEYCGYMTEDVADGDCCFGLTYFKDNTLKSVDDWGFITSIEDSKITHFMKVEN